MFNMHNTHAPSISNGDKFVRDLFFTLGVCLSARQIQYNTLIQSNRIKDWQKYNINIAWQHGMPRHAMAYTL